MPARALRRRRRNAVRGEVGEGATEAPSDSSSVHGTPGGDAAIGTVAHPAAGALAEVVIDTRRDTRTGEQRNGLHRRHEAGFVEPDADGAAGTQREQLLLLRHVPGAVAGADPVGDLQTALDPLLAEDVVDVLGQALDGARAHAVEHGRQRQLARLPQLGAAALERFADRADGGRELGHGAPRALDPRNRQRDPARLERVAVAAGGGSPPDYPPPPHSAPPRRPRPVEEGQGPAPRGGGPRPVPPEAQEPRP